MAFLKGLRIVVEALTVTIVQLRIRFVTLVIFVRLLEHGEDEDHAEGADHRGRSLRTEWQCREDRDEEEVDVGGTLELVEERQGDPCQ